MLRYDALEIAFADRLEEPAAVAPDALEEHQLRLDARHDARKSTLALHDRQRAHILAIDR